MDKAEKYLHMCQDEDLASHDRKYHPHGYHEGDSCKLRDSLAKGDKADVGIDSTNSLVTPEEDAAYMDAVKRGDMETARRMVREAAAKAGYNTAAWHGTKLEYMNDGKPWNVFDDLSHFGTKGQADLVSQSKSKETGGNKPYVYSVYLDLKNSKRVPDVPNDWNDTHSEYWYAQSKKAIDEGYDSIVYKNDYESKRGGKGDSYLPFYPSQIKSADPVTYDDAGNVIPLSERFNMKSTDIRY